MYRVSSHSMILPCVSIALTMLLSLACAPTYAPPIRSNHYGAPGTFEAGRMEVGGGGFVGGGIVGGGGQVNVAPLDWLQVELGLDGLNGGYC